MYSRAHLLIQKEINEINAENGFSIAKLNDENIFELIALIEGLPKTSWENGIFQIFLKFSENYNFVPPKVFFQTIPYHPNVDINTGRPSLDFLDDLNKWKPDYTIKHILKSLQFLLANPLLDRSVNMDAVFMLKGNPMQYEGIVRQSVNATQRIRQILKVDDANDAKSSSPARLDHHTRLPLFKINKEPTKIIKNEKDYAKHQAKNKSFTNISYDDYCKLWKGIATTKSNNEEENIYIKNDLFQNPNLMSQHISISLKELEDQINKQLTEHKNIMYGKFDFEPKINLKEQKIQNTIPINNENAKTNKNSNQVKAVNYNDLNTNKLQNQNNKSEAPITSSNPVNNKPKFEDTDDDLFENEVDELINWTKNI